jgi:hypothetical protein
MSTRFYEIENLNLQDGFRQERNRQGLLAFLAKNEASRHRFVPRYQRVLHLGGRVAIGLAAYTIGGKAAASTSWISQSSSR